MPELRFDPLGRRHILLAPERARRGAPAFETFPTDPEPCDFCGGREDRTPSETFAVREPDTEPDGPGWRVRVVPNLYPATPFHEVVIHTPDHYVHFEEQDLAHRIDIVRTYRNRIREAPTRCAMAVWNRGRPAGASRSHGHGQIFGIHELPTVEREVASFAEAGCPLCTIADDDDFVTAKCGEFRIVAHPVPFVASELLIVPPHSLLLDDDQVDDAAEAVALAVRSTLRELGSAVPFNLIVHTAPRDVRRFHWHAHLMPRTAVWGGLEMGAELPIVAADPYETARRLRTS
jgi:UDPglucose--hexose-1-phosphate uridylyltransferase